MQAMQGSVAAMGDVRGGILYSWWQAAGTIPDANIKEHVENPTQGQLYAGGTCSVAWTVALRTIWSGTLGQYVFDSTSGRIIMGYSGGGSKGFFADAWTNTDLFPASDSVIFLISSGSSIQAYLNNVALGSPLSSANDIGGTTRWRSAITGGTVNPWVNAVPKGLVCNIALDATQRAALYTSMMS